MDNINKYAFLNYSSLSKEYSIIYSKILPQQIEKHCQSLIQSFIKNNNNEKIKNQNANLESLIVENINNFFKKDFHNLQKKDMVKIINEKIAALEKDCETAIMDQFTDTYFKYKNTKEKKQNINKWEWKINKVYWIGNFKSN